MSETIEGLTEEECLVCDRVGTKEFYQELRQMGISPEDSKTTLKTLAQVYFADNLVFAGRPRQIIKAAITYLTLGQKYNLSKDGLARDYSTTGHTIRRLVKDILKATPQNILKATPQIFSNQIALFEAEREKSLARRCPQCGHSHALPFNNGACNYRPFYGEREKNCKCKLRYVGNGKFEQKQWIPGHWVNIPIEKLGSDEQLASSVNTNPQ